MFMGSTVGRLPGSCLEFNWAKIARDTVIMMNRQAEKIIGTAKGKVSPDNAPAMTAISARLTVVTAVRRMIRPSASDAPERGNPKATMMVADNITNPANAPTGTVDTSVKFRSAAVEKSAISSDITTNPRSVRSTPI
ncbi:MAG: hypothetical protein WBA02_12395 [Jannaschia helgolandensis]|uniref:hypothetical protein n=1 Tax=Jannaschia helgolandensis TaxID=188906 RepID=UPI001FE10077|nr:hypothetical protein [Jannaschia helgolandensis]